MNKKNIYTEFKEAGIDLKSFHEQGFDLIPIDNEGTLRLVKIKCICEKCLNRYANSPIPEEGWCSLGHIISYGDCKDFKEVNRK